MHDVPRSRIRVDKHTYSFHYHHLEKKNFTKMVFIDLDAPEKIIALVSKQLNVQQLNTISHNSLPHVE